MRGLAGLTRCEAAPSISMRSWPLLLAVMCLMMMMMIDPANSSTSMRSALMSSGLELNVLYRYSRDFGSFAPSPTAPSGGEDSEEIDDMLWAEVGFSNVKGGSVRFFEKLLSHDHHRRRHLLNSSDVVSLAPNNSTSEIASLGGLHYAIVTIGSPSKQFLVALDTGSDLLWVPCQCQQCATADWSLYGVQGLPEFAIYDPSNSNTSKIVSCSDGICVNTLSPYVCVGNGACSYNANYLSANTSSSGIIVQDVLYLNSENSIGSSIETPIYFGCGQVQTGLFLDVAPNGLFGLGPEVYSVPSTLAANSIVSNHIFSMCFTYLGTRGRLIFGKKPPNSSIVSQTPLIPITPSVFYVLKVSSFMVDTTSVNVTGNTIFDTGTSVTLFPATVVKAIGDMFNIKFGSQASPIELQGFTIRYCWNINTLDVETLPPLSIVFDGGSAWEVLRPFLGIGDNSGNLLYVCLGILEDPDNRNSIIGYNFMEGYEYFFDQASSLFSWVPSNCSDSTSTTTTQSLPSIENFNITSSPNSPPESSQTSAPSPTSSTSISTSDGDKMFPVVSIIFIISNAVLGLVLQFLC